MKNYDELIAMLAQGASISRERNMNLDFAGVADNAAKSIQELQSEVTEHIAVNYKLAKQKMALEVEVAEYRQAADTQAAAHKVERDELNAQYSDALGQISHLDAKLAAGAAPQAQPLTDEAIYKVVRSKHPRLYDDCESWKLKFEACKYWLEAAHRDYTRRAAMTNKLPPLQPMPFVQLEDALIAWAIEYGQQCRDAALDEAAKVCDDKAINKRLFLNESHYIECRDAIKGLK
jgi:hypothetical protein